MIGKARHEVWQAVTRNPLHAAVLLAQSGFTVDRYGVDALKEAVSERKFDIPPTSMRDDDLDFLYAALQVALDHAEIEEMFRNRDIHIPSIITEDASEILIHAVYHPGGVVTMRNYEHEIRLVTDKEHLFKIVDPYIESICRPSTVMMIDHITVDGIDNDQFFAWNRHGGSNRVLSPHFADNLVEYLSNA